MAKWAEIKCERCAETDALWEDMERALEESDAREARLERWLAESETREETLNDRIIFLKEHLCLTEEKLSKCEALLAKAVVALQFYAWENEARLPSDGPWGAGSTDFGKVARTTLAAVSETHKLNKEQSGVATVSEAESDEKGQGDG